MNRIVLLIILLTLSACSDIDHSSIVGDVDSSPTREVGGGLSPKGPIGGEEVTIDAGAPVEEISYELCSFAQIILPVRSNELSMEDKHRLEESGAIYDYQILDDQPVSFCVNPESACEISELLSPYCEDRDGDCLYHCNQPNVVPDVLEDCDDSRSYVTCTPPTDEALLTPEEPDVTNQGGREDAMSHDYNELMLIPDLISRCNDESLLVHSYNEQNIKRLAFNDETQQWSEAQTIELLDQVDINWLECHENVIYVSGTNGGVWATSYVFSVPWTAIRDASIKVTNLRVDQEGQLSGRDDRGHFLWNYQGEERKAIPDNAYHALHENGHSAWLTEEGLWIQSERFDARLLHSGEISSLIANDEWLIWIEGEQVWSYPWGAIGSDLPPPVRIPLPDTPVISLHSISQGLLLTKVEQDLSTDRWLLINLESQMPLSTLDELPSQLSKELIELKEGEVLWVNVEESSCTIEHIVLQE